MCATIVAQGWAGRVVLVVTMDITGASSGSAQVAGQFQVAVAKKALDGAREQGRQSLELIQSASAPANVPNGVGRQLNIRA
jgi:hypothetical protein